MLKNILEKDIMQMLRLSTTLLTENPLPLSKAAAAQNLSVKNDPSTVIKLFKRGSFLPL